MLNAEHVTIRFGGITAVNDVSIHLERNKITALIGPNGAGKTTFFNCISGVYTPNEGTIVFEGQHIEGKKGYQICEAGLSRTYQVINLSWKMTALENILVGMNSNLKSTFWQSLFHTKFQREEEQAESFWTLSASETGKTSWPAVCPTANSAFWRSLVRWPASRSSCCSTSPRPA
mgnify:CR=1 FL=1